MLGFSGISPEPASTSTKSCISDNQTFSPSSAAISACSRRVGLCSMKRSSILGRCANSADGLRTGPRCHLHLHHLHLHRVLRGRNQLHWGSNARRRFDVNDATNVSLCCLPRARVSGWCRTGATGRHDVFLRRQLRFTATACWACVATDPSSGLQTYRPR